MTAWLAKQVHRQHEPVAVEIAVDGSYSSVDPSETTGQLSVQLLSRPPSHQPVCVPVGVLDEAEGGLDERLDGGVVAGLLRPERQSCGGGHVWRPPVGPERLEA